MRAIVLSQELDERAFADAVDALESCRDLYEEDMSLLDDAFYEIAAEQAYKFGLTYDKTVSDIPLTYGDLIRVRHALETAQAVAIDVCQDEAADEYGRAVDLVTDLLDR